MTHLQNVQAENALYIGGEWQAGVSTVANINPSDISENIGNFAQASAEQVQQAISAAKYAQPEWEKLGGHERAKVLYALARLIQKHSRLISVLESLD